LGAGIRQVGKLIPRGHSICGGLKKTLEAAASHGVAWGPGGQEQFVQGVISRGAAQPSKLDF